MKRRNKTKQIRRTKTERLTLVWKATHLMLKGKTHDQAARTLRVNQNSLYRWLVEFRQDRARSLRRMDRARARVTRAKVRRAG